MKTLDIGLPQHSQPFSWAVQTQSIVFTAHGPIRADGTLDDGSIEVQTRLTFDNLRRAAEAAGGSLRDVAQVLIYMKDVTDMPAIDAIYREYFSAPYPNRSSVGVAGFVHPGMKIEIVAYIAVGDKA
ncbi:RidA family protein [Chitinasiproducens palmae]|uniref:Enamine deaminase RidA, house cleaning of reactive enamine intermediates, YjgF/YER057c/UK114 family n=1 Tax=Chitinasiproducens palmae TaxID=1770053 RepID=A0A1H2PNF8_9BURK|nr:RidA family protein [Chitinasiproducens palmae]SDV48185.1 Enamine deaminase RidA, house cleaning of reactive enamine intermediates, YjgF/YER057c/UK114 family [Chitinasiproducens palmae]